MAAISTAYRKVHAAKGQEYDRVYIVPDAAVVLPRYSSTSASEFEDETNIAAVVSIRTIRDIYIPSNLKNLISGKKEVLCPIWGSCFITLPFQSVVVVLAMPPTRALKDLIRHIYILLRLVRVYFICPVLLADEKKSNEVG